MNTPLDKEQKMHYNMKNGCQICPKTQKEKYYELFGKSR